MKPSIIFLTAESDPEKLAAQRDLCLKENAILGLELDPGNIPATRHMLSFVLTDNTVPYMISFRIEGYLNESEKKQLLSTAYNFLLGYHYFKHFGQPVIGYYPYPDPAVTENEIESLQAGLSILGLPIARLIALPSPAGSGIIAYNDAIVIDNFGSAIADETELTVVYKDLIHQPRLADKTIFVRNTGPQAFQTLQTILGNVESGFSATSPAMAEMQQEYKQLKGELNLALALVVSLKEDNLSHKKYLNFLKGIDTPPPAQNSETKAEQPLSGSIHDAVIEQVGDGRTDVFSLKNLSQTEKVRRYYHTIYEPLPMWYKRLGQVIKVMQGKRTYKSLFDKSVKRYNTEIFNYVEQPTELDKIKQFYYFEYEILPSWYKRSGRFILSFKNLFKRKNKQKKLVQLQKSIANVNEVEKIRQWYYWEYEVLPMWYKKFGHLIKVMTGKRTFKSLYKDDVQKYKD